MTELLIGTRKGLFALEGEPGDDREHLVRCRVEVVEGEHAVDPRPAPAVIGERRSRGIRAGRRGIDAVIHEHGE